MPNIVLINIIIKHVCISKIVNTTLVLFITFIFVRSLRRTVSKAVKGFNTRCGDQYLHTIFYSIRGLKLTKT